MKKTLEKKHVLPRFHDKQVASKTAPIDHDVCKLYCYKVKLSICILSVIKL